ncbi:hypothetical protein AAZX31_12G082300 [Glycine max]
MPTDTWTSFEEVTPPDSSNFESIEKVRKFYTSFAKKNGFGYVFNQRRRTQSKKLSGEKKCSTLRKGCQASITISRGDVESNWPKSVCYMRYHKNMRAAAKVLVKKFEDEGLPTVKVAIVLNNGDSSFSNRDSWNHIKNLRRKNLDVGVIEAVFNYCKWKQSQMVNFFWVDARARVAYQQFGDVITFATTYKTPKYILFGCALLQDESESTFTCLFKTWLEAMGGKKNPVSILIDQDLAIGAAIAKHLMIGYKLEGNEWLIGLYRIRESWVHRSESINAFFDSFVHTTTTLQEFVVKFEKAVDSRLEAKRREDYESRHKSHILSIWSKLENHAAFVYTRNVLGKFQDELRKINQYTKKKIKRDGSVMSIEYLTSKIAKCGCQLYEFIGILCKHILMIFKAKGIVEIPNHFVLQRWTKDANKGLEAGYTEDKFVGASITPRILRMMLAQQQANILVDHAEDSEDMYKFIILQFAKTHKLTIIMQTNFNDADNMPLLESDRTNGNQHCTLEQMSKAPHLILGDPAYHKGEKKG